MNVYILLSSSIESEMYNRMNFSLQLYIEKPCIFLLSGTEGETQLMYNYLYPRLNPDIVILEKCPCYQQGNTVDTIHNSFSLLLNGKLGILAYGEFNIICSDYEKNRIHYTCSSLDCTKNLKITYHELKTENSELLQSRLIYEKLIFRNKHIYDRFISFKNGK